MLVWKICSGYVSCPWLYPSMDGPDFDSGPSLRFPSAKGILFRWVTCLSDLGFPARGNVNSSEHLLRGPSPLILIFQSWGSQRTWAGFSAPFSPQGSLHCWGSLFLSASAGHHPNPSFWWIMLPDLGRARLLFGTGWARLIANSPMSGSWRPWGPGRKAWACIHTVWGHD